MTVVAVAAMSLIFPSTLAGPDVSPAESTVLTDPSEDTYWDLGGRKPYPLPDSGDFDIRSLRVEQDEDGLRLALSLTTLQHLVTWWDTVEGAFLYKISFTESSTAALFEVTAVHRGTSESGRANVCSRTGPQKDCTENVTSRADHAASEIQIRFSLASLREVSGGSVPFGDGTVLDNWQAFSFASSYGGYEDEVVRRDDARSGPGEGDFVLRSPAEPLPDGRGGAGPPDSESSPPPRGQLAPREVPSLPPLGVLVLVASTVVAHGLRRRL